MSCCQALSFIEATRSINRMPVSNFPLLNSGMFRRRATRTKTAGIMVNNVPGVGILPAKAWCCDEDGANLSADSQKLIPVQIPHTPITEALMVCDVDGAIDAMAGNGTQSLQLLQWQDARVRKYQKIRYAYDVTMEYRMLGALSGKVLDANGTDVLLDVFKLFGVTQQTQTVTTSGSDISVIMEEIRSAAVKSRLGARSFVPSGYTIYAGVDFFNKLLSNPGIFDLYKRDFAAYSAQQMDAMGDRIRLPGGVTIIRYEGPLVVDPVTGQELPLMLAHDEAFMVPTAPAGFDVGGYFVAPPETVSTVNQLAAMDIYLWEKPINRRSENAADADGIKITGESNYLPFIEHPASIIKLLLA